jgi:hypothetical protein
MIQIPSVEDKDTTSGYRKLHYVILIRLRIVL